MPKDTNLEGGCFCGAVRFRLDLPSKWCAHCHCSMCRRIHGAGYVTWVGFKDSQFGLKQGDNELAWYQSSAQAQRGFCRQCGSSMLFKSERWPGEIHVALACIDGPIDRKPQAHAFYDTHVDWMPVDGELQIFKG
jgi:hypothetical protein